MNAVKKRPAIGDIAIIQNGKKRFVSGKSCTKSFIESQDCIGVVYDVQGDLVRVVAGVNNQAKQWSCVADYKITSVPSSSGDCTVTLNDTVIGTFTYDRTTGTPEEFATQLNTWLRTMDSNSDIAKKWEAYTYNGESYLQQSTYNQYENTVSITGCSLTKLIGNEVAKYTVSYNLNSIKQSHWATGMNKPSMYDFFRTWSNGANDPKRVLDITKELYPIYPVTQMYYDSSWGDNIRAVYSSYDSYLEACLMRQRELNKSSVQFRDGKLYTSLLKDKKVLQWGNEVYAYPAARYCYEYDSGVEGYGPGSFWLPSLYELSLLMRPIHSINSVFDDPINVALSKNSKWSLISSSAARWSSSRYGSNYAWFFNGDGISYGDHFYCSFTCSPVLSFTIA